jgi:hypothetical protein
MTSTVVNGAHDPASNMQLFAAVHALSVHAVDDE